MASGAAAGFTDVYEGKGLPAEGRVWPLMAAAPLAFAGDAAGLRRLLEAGLAAGEVFLPSHVEGPAEPDLEATLWFVLAGHAHGEAGGEEAFVRQALLPRGKGIVQAVIAGDYGGLRMDDGGMLVVEGAAGLRMNGLWYAALETIAEGLHAAGDRVGDHFERLAARFRRSFAKAYWCEEHGRICIPTAEGVPHAEIPVADHVLLSVLPVSPIPRTKQRQGLLQVREAGLGEVGVKVESDGEVVESVLHRVWLARALAATADPSAASVADAAAVLAGLREQIGAQAAALYRHGRPIGGPDLLATAEVRAAFARM